LVSLAAAEPALQLFGEATGRHSGAAKLWMGLGIAQSLSARPAESANSSAQAASSLMRAADLDPEYLPTYRFLAGLSGTSMAMDAEIRHRLQVLVVAHPESAEAHYDYALALWKHAKLEPSEQLNLLVENQLRQAIAQHQGYAAAHVQLGEVYQQAGDYAQAVSELALAVQLDPDNAAAHYRLAMAYRRNHQPEPADLELAKFKQMHAGSLPEDDITQAGLRVYSAQLSRALPLAVSCR
jgi:tetratricopeptide (TPR) repeat protein